ncbi:MAG: hypothetical protein ACXIU7_00500 [Roseinatronobacter sp.]
MALLCATRSQAEPSLGVLRAHATEPAFEAAFALWLEADESRAIPALGNLARDGNHAAQILLGQIDRKAALQGPELAQLDNTARHVLLRAQGGRSGINWLRHLAPASTYARMLRDAWSANSSFEHVEWLAAHGEAGNSREAYLILVARNGPVVPPDPALLDWLGAPVTSQAEIAAALTQVSLPLAPDTGAQLIANPFVAPLHVICSARCPETVTDCSLALLAGLGSYTSLLTLGSPAAALISDDAFARTARAQQMLARQIMLRRSMRMRAFAMQDIAERDQCAAEWLAEEFTRYSRS